MPRAAVEAPKQDAKGEKGELQAEHSPAGVLARGDLGEWHGGLGMDGGGLRQPENGVGLVLGKADFILWGGGRQSS